MALDPLASNRINLDNIIVNPLEHQLKRQQLTNARQANTLGDIRIGEERMKADEMQQDRQDADTLSQEFTNPEHLDDKGRFNWDSYRDAVKGKVRLRNLQKLDSDHRTEQQSALSLKNQERISRQLDTQAAGNEVAAMLNVPYEQRKALLGPALDRLKDSHFDLGGYENLDPTDANLRAMAARVGYYQDILSFDQKTAEAKRRTAVADRADTQAANMELDENEKKAQRLRENAARDYLAVPNSPDPQAAHQAWFAKWGQTPEYAGMSAYDPKNMGLLEEAALPADKRIDKRTAAQREKDDQAHRAELERQGQDRNDIARTRNQQVARGETAHQLEADAQKHDALQTKEQEKWALNQRLWDVIGNVADDEDFHDPRRAYSEYPVKMTPELRADLQSAQKKVESEAKALAEQQKEIRRRHGGGEFAPAAGGGAAPTGQPAGAAPAPTGRPRSRNKATGEELEYDGTNWVPIASAAPAPGGIRDLRASPFSGKKPLSPL